MIKYFESYIQHLRLADQYHAFLEHCRPSLEKAWANFARPYSNIFPPLTNFTNSAEVRELLNIESEEDIDVDFDTLLPVIPNIVSDWKDNVYGRLNRHLNSELSQYLSQIRPGVPVSDLAIAHILRCTECGQFVLNRDVMPALHHCPHGRRNFKERLKDSKDPFVRALVKLDLQSWHQDEYQVLPDYVRQILLKCGKGLQTTVDELDKLDPRLLCEIGQCKTSGLREVYHWRDAVRLYLFPGVCILLKIIM